MDFKELYKKGVDLGVQQQQRQLQLLNEQKRRRLNLQDENRQLVVPPDVAQPNGQNKQKQQRKWQRASSNKTHLHLQQSEWLRQRPDNLCDWLMVPCPSGKRCLVIASNGRTRVYNKAGRQIMELRTLLPGDGHMHKYKTMLDCVYVPDLDSFYVLDALAYGQQQLQDCETTFRFYWLHARFDEHSELMQRSKRNEKTFHLLAHYDFEDAAAVAEALQRYPHWTENKPQLDGLLFYHKEASYTCGSTPLVCWLFAFMLPDVLGLPAHSSYAPPADYQPSAVLAYMDEFDRKLLAQRQLLKKHGKAAKKIVDKKAAVAMDLEVADEEEEEDEDVSLGRVLQQQRRLELGELLDMDCEAVEPQMQAARSS